MIRCSDIERKVPDLADWAKSKESIDAITLFGSRFTGAYRTSSDVDLALTLNGSDDQILDTYVCHAQQWRDELTRLIGLPVDLQLAHPVLSPCVWSYLETGAREVFARKSAIR